jgi:hypothetical protein
MTSRPPTIDFFEADDGRGTWIIAALLVVAIVALYYVMPSGDREFLVTATFVMIAIVLWAVMLASFVVGK